MKTDGHPTTPSLHCTRYKTLRLLAQSLLNAAHTGPASTVPVIPLPRVAIVVPAAALRTFSVSPTSSYASALSPTASLFVLAIVEGDPLPWLTHHDFSALPVALNRSNAT